MNKVRLSMRVRPNSEVAPWVLVEIKALERDLGKYGRHLSGCWMRLNMPSQGGCTCGYSIAMGEGHE
jgi:hypothetical protein